MRGSEMRLDWPAWGQGIGERMSVVTQRRPPRPSDPLANRERMGMTLQQKEKRMQRKKCSMPSGMEIK